MRVINLLLLRRIAATGHIVELVITA